MNGPNAIEAENNVLKEHVHCVYLSEVLSQAKFISLNAVYKIKVV